MYAAQRSLFHSVLLATATGTLLLPLSRASGQQQQGGADAKRGVLVFSTKNTAAADELHAAIDDYFRWNWKSGADHATRALELDEGFGLARIWKATFLGGPDTNAEMQRAVTDAAAGNAGEAVLALAAREESNGREASAAVLFDAAATLAPNDRFVALWRASSQEDDEGISALRQVVDKYPDDAGAKIFLAYALSPWSYASVPTARANFDEAMRVAGDAVRLLPQSAGAHTVVGQVLHANGRDAEALQHLQAAASMTPKFWYTFGLIADIRAREGKFADIRDLMDSIVTWAPGLAQKVNARRLKAAYLLGDGDVQNCMTELDGLIGDLERIGAHNELATTHGFTAGMASAAHDSVGAMHHMAAAKANGLAGAALADNEVVVYSLIGNATEARRALGDYVRISNSRRNLTAVEDSARTAEIHRVTGLTLLAEKQPEQAIRELRQAGKNPYAFAGIIEAYRQMKNMKQADAERALFFARREYTYGSSALQVIRYRGIKR